MLEEQELDSSAANPQGQETETKTDSGKNGADSSEQLRWSDVYKEALTPVVDSTGIITIYLPRAKMLFIMMEKRRQNISHLIKEVRGNILVRLR